MKKIFLSIISLSIFAISSLTGCQNKPKQKTFYDDNYTLYQDISYGSHYRHRYDLCIPKSPSKPNGLLLYIHGGGWAAGDKDAYWHSLANDATSFGVTVAAMDYRYANNKDTHYQEILDDIYNCVSSIKEMGKNHNLDLKHMITSGGSAGGHLSLFYSYRMKDKSPITPTAAISYCGITDFLDPNFYNQEDKEWRSQICRMLENVTGEKLSDGISKKEEETLLDVSPLNYVDSNTVPTLFAHGDIDNVVPYSNATSLKEKLDLYKVKNDFVTFNNSGHGLENDPIASQQMNEKIVEYLAYL
jgi:acetyl esterase/lipase